MSFVDYLIIAGVAIFIILAIRSSIKQRKNGGCGCGCGSCPYKDNCEKK